MKSKLLPLLTTGLLFCSIQQKAQVSTCAFTQTLSTYGAANTGSLVGPLFQNDNVTNVTLPFNFTFNGTAHTTLNVCANGYLSFAALTGTEYFAISDPGTTNVISPFGNDLYKGTIITADMTAGSNSLTNCSSTAGFSVGDIFFDYGSDFSSNPTITSIVGNTIVLNQNALYNYSGYDMVGMNGTIKQSVNGVSPNRICEFEFAKFSVIPVYDEILNFKVRLYETSNKIEFVYGLMAVNVDYTPSEVGLKGASNTDFNSRTVVSSVNTWSNSAAATSINDICDFDNTIFPASGQSYMWTPPSCTVPVVVVTPVSAAICAGQSVVLTASGATTYSWTNGPATAQQTVTPAATTAYTVIGANGTCTTSLTYTQNVAATPTLTITASNSLSCAGNTVALNATGATSYSWNTVAGTSQTVIAPSTTTSYSISGSNGTCTAKQTFTQTVLQFPVLSIVQTPTLTCVGQPATLTISGATSYSYNNVAGTSSTVLSPSVTTTYTITGANGACATTKTVTQKVMVCNVGINESSFESVGITAYPNPFSAELNVKNSSENELNVTISDALGRVVYSATLKAESSETISAESLTSGLYFISVNGAKGTLTKKLIKH